MRCSRRNRRLFRQVLMDMAMQESDSQSDTELVVRFGTVAASLGRTIPGMIGAEMRSTNEWTDDQMSVRVRLNRHEFALVAGQVPHDAVAADGTRLLLIRCESARQDYFPLETALCSLMMYITGGMRYEDLCGVTRVRNLGQMSMIIQAARAAPDRLRAVL